MISGKVLDLIVTMILSHTIIQFSQVFYGLLNFSLWSINLFAIPSIKCTKSFNFPLVLESNLKQNVINEAMSHNFFGRRNAVTFGIFLLHALKIDSLI